MNAFKEVSDPIRDMDIGIKSKIISVLENIFNDYKNKKVIDRLSKKYGNTLTSAYIRKIIGAQIIIRMTKSKKNMYYNWNAGGNPDFNSLADKVLAYSTRTPVKKRNKDLTSFYTSKLSLLLFRNGVYEDKIPQLTQEILEMFYPE